MSLTLPISRLASWAGLAALWMAAATPRALRAGPPRSRRIAMALATFALGMALFALFFGLVAACDRL